MHPTQKTIDMLRIISERINKLTARKQFDDYSFNPPRERKVAKDVQEPTNQVTLPGNDKARLARKRGSVKPKGNKIRKHPGHPDQEVHGRRGSAKISPEKERGIADQIHRLQSKDRRATSQWVNFIARSYEVPQTLVRERIRRYEESVRRSWEPFDTKKKVSKRSVSKHGSHDQKTHGSGRIRTQEKINRPKLASALEAKLVSRGVLGAEQAVRDWVRHPSLTPDSVKPALQMALREVLADNPNYPPRSRSKRRRGPYSKVTKRSVGKHAQHDQQSHDPTRGRGGRTNDSIRGPEDVREGAAEYNLRFKPVTMSSPEEAKTILQQVKAGVKKPYVNAQVSTLGGAHRPSVMLTISLDPKETWTNGILENSRYGKFHIRHDGRVSQISGPLKFRSVKPKNIEHLVSLLNKLKERDKSDLQHRPRKVTKGDIIKHPGHPDQRVHGHRGVYTRAAGAGAAGAVAGRALAPAVRGLATTAAASRAISSVVSRAKRLNPKATRKFKRLKRRGVRALRRHTAKLRRAIAPAAKAGLRVASRVKVPGAIGIGLMAAAAGLGLVAQHTRKVQKAGGLTAGDHVLVLSGDEAIVGVYAGNDTVRVLTNDSYVDTKPPKNDVLLIQRGATVPDENSDSKEIESLVDTLNQEKQVMENLSEKVKNEKVEKRRVGKHASHDQSAHGRRGVVSPRHTIGTISVELGARERAGGRRVKPELRGYSSEELEQRRDEIHARREQREIRRERAETRQYRPPRIRIVREQKVTKRSKVDKHAMGQHDQSKHGNRFKQTVRGVRAKARRVGRRVESEVRQAGARLHAGAETTRQVANDLDTLLQGLEAGTRIYDKVKSLRDTLVGESEKVTKAKMSDKELAESKRLAERLKGKAGITNPHALARWQVQQKLTKLEQVVSDIVKQRRPRRRMSPPASRLRSPKFRITPGRFGASAKPRTMPRMPGRRTSPKPRTMPIVKPRKPRTPRIRFAKIQSAFEKGIGHSLRTLTNALRLIGEQEADKKISEADEKRLQEIIAEIRSMVGYLEEVKEQGFFEKGEAKVPDSTMTYRPSFTTPAVAEHLKRQGIKPNAKGRGESTHREPGY